MECVLKVVIILLFTCLNIKLLSTMHNPMMRIRCALGEELVCKVKLIFCWKYNCQCLPDHIPLSHGFGCLLEEFANPYQ